jgi:C1A family cysteine protease
MKTSLLIGLAVVLLCMVPIPLVAQTQLQQELKAKGARWEAGETSMSKLPVEEQKRRLGGMHSLTPGKGRLLTSVTPPHALSPSLDWRNNGGNYVSRIRNQGSCGSCWAFATTAALESATMITRQQPNTDLNLSEQVALSCSGAGNCEAGGYPDAVSTFFVSTGLPLDSCYPYTATDGTCTACANWQASTYKIKSWSWVITYGQTPSVDQIKGALADQGPLVATMHVYDDFFSYKSGIYHHVSGTLAGDHAVLIVGYDDANQCFIVKNSWGTSWGEAGGSDAGGYFRIAYTEATGDSRFGFETIAYHNDAAPPSTDYTISKLLTSAASTGKIRVTAGSGCAWTATSNATWITISAGSGTGPGTVSYTVAANTQATRTGTITVQGHAYAFTQAGTVSVAAGAR